MLIVSPFFLATALFLSWTTPLTQAWNGCPMTV